MIPLIAVLLATPILAVVMIFACCRSASPIPPELATIELYSVWQPIKDAELLMEPDVVVVDLTDGRVTFTPVPSGVTETWTMEDFLTYYRLSTNQPVEDFDHFGALGEVEEEQ